MKKIKILAISTIAALMSISACNSNIYGNSSVNTSKNDPSSQISADSSVDSKESINSNFSESRPTSSQGNQSSDRYQNSSSSIIDDDEEYTITVTQTTGVTATTSKNKAKAGEKITLTLKVENGYTIKEVTATNTKLEKVSDTKYEFTMPERSVRITIYVDVAGDVTVTGELAAVFQKQAGKNLFIAKDVKVESSKAKVGFDVVVRGNDGTTTKLKATDFDESRSFADVEGTYKSNYALQIASGSTYDFYYEPEAECPLYILRTRVDKIPTNADGVYSLFSGRMRSNPSLHPTDLVGIKYTYDNPKLKYEYDYKLYGNNVSLATIKDTSDANNVGNYFVYKKADLTKNLYTVVNTWTKAKGNNENSDYVWNLDPYKEDENLYWQPYAARLDITPRDEDTPRKAISVRNALRDVKAGAHYGAELEYEFYDTYRSVYDGNVIINAPKNYNLDLKTTPKSDGTFDVDINSWTEYDYDATANTADATAHEGNVYKAKLHFLANGALETADVTKEYYDQKSWNFKTHLPASEGVVTHFTVKNTFGAVNSGTPNFDETPYFISKVKTAAWYNSLTGKTPSTSESHVNYNDALEIIPYGNGGKRSKLCTSFTFEPSTALDAWQYKVVASSDTSKINLNNHNVFAAVGVGSADVTIANEIKNDAEVKLTTKVTSYAAGTVHSFFINGTVQGYDSFGCDNATILEAYAGKRTTYFVDTGVNTGAPCEYELWFRSVDEWGDYTYKPTCDYITVVQTGSCLILDCNNEKANALTERWSVTVKVRSNYYLTGWGPSTWTINVNPKNPDAKDVVGTTWICDSYVDENKVPTKDYTLVKFDNNLVDADNLIYSGSIEDYRYNGDTLMYTSRWTFKYQIAVSGKILSQITGFETNDPMFAGEPYYYFGLDFGGFQKQFLLVALWYESQDQYADILGFIDFDGEGGVIVESYYGFTSYEK